MNELAGFTPSYRYLYHNTIEGEGGRVIFGLGTVDISTIAFNNLASAVGNPYGAIAYDSTPYWGGVTVAQNAVTPTIPSEWTAGNSGFSARSDAFSSVFQNQATGDLRPATDLVGLASQAIIATGYTEIGCDLNIVASKVSGVRTQGNLATGTP